MEVIFPEISSSKRCAFMPDAITVPKSALLPASCIRLHYRNQKFVQNWSHLTFPPYDLTLDSITLTMQSFDSLIDPKELHTTLKANLEIKSTLDATHCTLDILDDSCEKPDLPSIVNKCCTKHLTTDQNNKLLRLLLTYEVLLDGTLRYWQTEPVSFESKLDAKLSHGRVFSMPHIHLQTLKKKCRGLWI